MNNSVYELRSFYKSKAGVSVRRLMRRHIRAIWPDTTAMRVMGSGYAVPYLRSFMKDSERVFSVMPPALGVHHWPESPHEAGLNCLAADTDLPFETESIDRALVIHGFEHAQDPGIYLHELWRVLKGNGRLLLVVPNRLGLWARADWTPFGHGTPYTAGQIYDLLGQHYFVRERTDRALFMPPFKSPLILRSAFRVEQIGRYIIPGLAGVHMIEASKQLYGARPLPRKALESKRRVFVPDALPT